VIERLDGWWTRHSDFRRYDRGPMYLTMMIALMFSAVSMLIQGPVPGSNLEELSEITQTMLALFLFAGSGLCVFGATVGSKYWFPRWGRIRSYRVGICGVPAVVTSLGFYSYAIYAGAVNVASALGGTLGPLMTLGTLINGFYFYLETRRIERNIVLVKKIEGQEE
jgi:hypothetical protein